MAILSSRPSSIRQVPSIVSVSKFAAVASTVAERRESVGFMSGAMSQYKSFFVSFLVMSKSPVELNESVECTHVPVIAWSNFDLAVPDSATRIADTGTAPLMHAVYNKVNNTSCILSR